VASIFPKQTDSIVGINITPRTMILSWISRANNQSLPFILNGYKHIFYDIHPKNSLVVFNPTRLKNLIQTFISLHELQDACFVFALSGEELIEKQVMLSKPAAELNKLEEPNTYAWHYYCLQNQAPGMQAPWYCCGLSRALLLQYQLLAIRCNINLIQITTPTMALFKAYTFLKKQGADQIKNNRTNIVDFLNLNGLMRIRSPQEHASVVESFGLFLLGKAFYGEH
jgi:hypothetical protein